MSDPTEDARDAKELSAAENADLCSGCVRCCTYITIEVDAPRADLEQLRRANVYSFRRSAGDDASCLNLFQAGRPQVLGVRSGEIPFHGLAVTHHAAFAEDQFAIEQITRLKDIDRGGDLVERHLPTDAAGIAMRRHLKALSDRERTHSS